MNVTSISDFRKDTKKYFNQVADDYDDLVILRSDGKKTVLIPFEMYNSIKETQYLLSSPVNAARLRRSVQDAREGKVTKRTLVEL